ncbi:nucleotide exchange factor GrpE [Rossellomorea vietnamensis]|uniref:GrpE protein homolog n=1 Tax=Rossellomorea vietnamensis TaxID=218284 RepID=A0A0P6WP10_9BACI|nr:nucleotide exchange factor GrpE [Rossellomorea vietnamensis]KPL59238.1 hypothetical protein AM506_11970 [Rossellomorea vietnamensis]
MTVSNEEYRKTLKRFGDTQVQFRKKTDQMNHWKTCFKELEGDVTNLMSFFEQKYEESVVGEEFGEDMKEKLENRRDGIRLSVKSSSRLLRRLNPDKPLETETAEFITDEAIKERLSSTSVISEETQIESIDEFKQPQLSESDMTSEEPVDVEVGEASPSETEASLVKGESEGSSDSNDNQDFSIVQEGGEYQANVFLLNEAIDNNIQILDQLEEDIQSAEKRFLSFIEKGVAPVLDGLYSGDKYGKELLEHLNAEDSVDTSKVAEWLEIYPTLMKEIKRLFDAFSIEYFQPDIGDPFNEEKHEPIGVVEDQEFKDEQIKEVVRYGLTFEKSAFDIRPAQVIVVRNKQAAEQRGIEDEV